MAYIQMEHYTKTLKGHTVLDDVTLSLERNKIYGFVGRNGSGKTMLFRAICGLIRPQSGFVEVDGKRIGRDISAPPEVGILLENAGLWPQYSGVENLQILSKLGKKLKKDEIHAAIRRVGLDPKDKRPVRKYSLGMKQRIVLAQALMEHPALLVLDEPTNALDENGVAQIRQILLEEKARGATILLASHNKEDIELLCDEIFHLEDGKLVEA